MGLCSGAAHVLAFSGMSLSCRLSPLHCRGSSMPQLAFSRSSLCQRESVQRMLPQYFKHRSRNQRGLTVSFMPKEGNQELTKEQKEPSSVRGDLPTSKTEKPTIVEHVVFFKVKDDPGTEEVFQDVRALKSLDCVSELSANKVLQILGSQADYTHVLHSRHPSKAALDAYAVHPTHQAVVKKLAPYVEDRLAVDWEGLPVGLPVTGGHGAARIALIKFSDGLTEEEILQVLALLKGLRDKFPFIQQINAGMNFSPARAKGFDVGFVATFNNLEELEQLNGNSELHAVLRRSKVAPFLTGFVIADLDSK